jgi:predicted Zn-dependent protease
LDDDIADAIDLAYSHSREGDHNLAIDLLRDILEFHPDNLSLRTTLGIIFAKAHRDRDSEKILRSVLRRDPYHVEATSALGRLLDNSLRSHESEQLFRKLLNAKPHCHIIAIDLSRLLLEEGRNDEAFSVARNHIEKNPDELNAFTPLRHILLLEETRLEDTMFDSNYNRKDWEFLVSNLLDQYELIKVLQKFSNRNELDSELNDLIQDDLIRLQGRFEELEYLLEKVDGQPSKRFRERMKEASLEISQHQKME